MAGTSIARLVPASLFGMVLGIIGLGNTWRLAHSVWGLPAIVGEVLMALGSLVWAILLVLYVLQWWQHPEVTAKEWADPIQCCFVGLIGVATMLVAGAALPYAKPVAWALFLTGAGFTLWFMLWRTGLLWRGERNPAVTTAVLYLPTVAGSFVIAIVAAALGHPDIGQIAFGGGLFSWFAIESVLLHRLYTAPVLAPALRPTLGIQLAPPTVGGVAYLGVTAGPPDVFAHALLGYGLIQALLLLRMLPWIREQAFAASYWAFTFGASALATGPLLMLKRADAGVVQLIAPCIFVGSNLVIGLIAAGTIRLLLSGRLLPKPVPA